MRSFYDKLYLATVELKIQRGKDHFSCYVESIECDDGSIKYVVSMDNKEDFYSLLHECLHLVKQIFLDRHIPFTAENDEAIAYYQEWWFKKLWRAAHGIGK